MKNNKSFMTCCLLWSVLLGFTACKTTENFNDPYHEEKTTPKTETVSERITVQEEITESEETSNQEETTEREETTNPIIEGDQNEILDGIEITLDMIDEPLFPVYEVNANTDSENPLANHTNDINLSAYTDTAFSPSSQTVIRQVNGKTIEGVYQNRIVSPYYQNNSLVYEMKTDNSPTVRIDISQETGNVVRYVSGSYREANGAILTETECLSIAEKVIAEVSDNPDSFVLTSKEYTYDKETERGRYLFSFNRYIGQMKTDEWIYVRVGEKGTVFSFVSNMLGNMDDVVVPNYHEKDVMAAVEYKIANIFKPYLDKYTCTYEIDDVCLTKLQDGKLYLKYLIIIGRRLDDSFTIHDSIQLLVCIS